MGMQLEQRDMGMQLGEEVIKAKLGNSRVLGNVTSFLGGVQN